MSYANPFILYVSYVCIQFGWKYLGKLLFENLQKRDGFNWKYAGKRGAKRNWLRIISKTRFSYLQG